MNNDSDFVLPRVNVSEKREVSFFDDTNVGKFKNL